MLQPPRFIGFDRERAVIDATCQNIRRIEVAEGACPVPRGIESARLCPIDPEAPNPKNTGVYTADGEPVPESAQARGHQPILFPVRPPAKTARRFRGRSLFLGYLRGHFGHDITEGLAYLDAFREGSGPADFDHLLWISTVPSLPGYMQRLLEWIPGFNPDAVRLVREPSVADYLEIVPPGLSLGNTIRRSFARPIRDTLPDSGEFDPAPLFFSRGRLEDPQPILEGEAELEARVVARGARVVHPQELDIREQVALVNRHRVLLGFQGSALHLPVFSRRGNRVYSYACNRPRIYFAQTDFIGGCRTVHIHGSPGAGLAAGRRYRQVLEVDWLVGAMERAGAFDTH